jgi:predicted HTH domain antitoxin
MTLTLPDNLGLDDLTTDDLRLELACALYARGRVGKVRGAELAGVDFFTFQGILGERGIERYTAEMLAEDWRTMHPDEPQ